MALLILIGKFNYQGFLVSSHANYFSRRNFMKITTDWLNQFFNIFSQLGKMLLYLYQLFRGKL